MKFTVILIAALAVVAAAESDGIVPKENNDLIHKLTKWLNFNLPLFAPIRTTPRPKPAPARPPAPRPTQAPRPRPTQAPRPAPSSEAPRPAPSSEAPRPAPSSEAPRPAPSSEAPQVPASTDSSHLPVMDPMMALNELYNMEGLKDMLPPMSEILNADPSKPDPMRKPVGEVANEITMNLMQSIIDFIASRPSGSVNLDDPISLTSDGKLASAPAAR